MSARRRYYTVVDAAPMGRGPEHVQIPELVAENTEMGRYAAQAPYQAAKKAASKIRARYKRMGVDADEFCFGIREQTRNAPRLMRLYTARRVRLETPVAWPVAGGTAGGGTAVKDHETRVKAVLDPEGIARVLACFSANKNLTEEYPKASGAAAGSAEGPPRADPARPDLFPP